MTSFYFLPYASLHEHSHIWCSKMFLANAVVTHALGFSLPQSGSQTNISCFNWTSTMYFVREERNRIDKNNAIEGSFYTQNPSVIPWRILICLLSSPSKYGWIMFFSCNYWFIINYVKLYLTLYMYFTASRERDHQNQ